VYLTGLGAVDNPVATGAAAPVSPFSQVPGVTATIGGRPAQVLFAGLAPGFAGLYQVNLLLPQVVAGDYALQISVPGAASNIVAISIR
jgi:adhesin/invasin